MKEHPIIFKDEMVRAILDGRKTQTRRIAKLDHAGRVRRGGRCWHPGDPVAVMACPYGQPGDRLWVRETHAFGCNYGGGDPVVFYRATGDGWIGSKSYPPADVMAGRFGISSGQPACSAPTAAKWRPSIHMPRWASRILLEVTSVRVERLQDVGESDAEEEGAPLELGELERTVLGARASHRSGFARLWQSINGPGSWGANPMVWVVEFEVLEPRP